MHVYEAAFDKFLKRSENSIRADRVRAQGVPLSTYADAGPAMVPAEHVLLVDQLMCAAAPYFLGNVPSTVTATIVQERDNRGWARENTDFFGFEAEGLRQFREGWAPTRAFAEEACV